MDYKGKCRRKSRKKIELTKKNNKKNETRATKTKKKARNKYEKQKNIYKIK